MFEILKNIFIFIFAISLVVGVGLGRYFWATKAQPNPKVSAFIKKHSIFFKIYLIIWAIGFLFLLF